MARKQMKVEGKTHVEVLSALTEAEGKVWGAIHGCEAVKGVFPTRDYDSLSKHLDKAVEIIHKRFEIMEKKVTSNENAEERKKTEKALREALKDPEKSEQIKAILGL